MTTSCVDQDAAVDVVVGFCSQSLVRFIRSSKERVSCFFCFRLRGFAAWTLMELKDCLQHMPLPREWGETEEGATEVVLHNIFL